MKKKYDPLLVHTLSRIRDAVLDRMLNMLLTHDIKVFVTNFPKDRRIPVEFRNSEHSGLFLHDFTTDIKQIFIHNNGNLDDMSYFFIHELCHAYFGPQFRKEFENSKASGHFFRVDKVADDFEEGNIELLSRCISLSLTKEQKKFLREMLQALLKTRPRKKSIKNTCRIRKQP